jgi:hypothetical protein
MLAFLFVLCVCYVSSCRCPVEERATDPVSGVNVRQHVWRFSLCCQEDMLLPASPATIR